MSDGIAGAVDALHAQGVNIIVDDLSRFETEPFYSTDGPASKAVASVTITVSARTKASLV